MRKFLIAIMIVLFLGGVAVASVNIKANGRNLGPAQDLNIVGITPTDNGPEKTLTITDVITTSNVVAAGINWTTVDVINTDNVVAAGINWTTIFKGDTSINWADITGL